MIEKVMNCKEDHNDKNELALYSEKIYNELEKIYKDTTVKSGVIKYSKPEQHLIARINELEKKIPQKSVLGLLLYNIYLHIAKIKCKFLINLKDIEVPIIVKEKSSDVLLDAHAKAKGGLSEVPPHLAQENNNPRIIEDEDTLDIQILSTIGDTSYILRKSPADSDERWEFVKEVCEDYEGLMRNKETIEALCGHLVRGSKIETGRKDNNLNVHKTMFARYIVDDIDIGVLFCLTHAESIERC